MTDPAHSTPNPAPGTPGTPASAPASIGDGDLHTRPGLLLVISGPSGVGKTTIVRYILEHMDVVFSVSVTTRSPGPNEVHGRDYQFISDQEFDQLREDGELLEWAEVFGNRYGTPRRPVRDAVERGRLVLLEIDVQGAIQVRRAMPEARGIFILPPDEPTLLQRLRDRKREDEATIQRRFSEAKREIAQAQASSAYDAFIVNDDLDRAQCQAVERIESWLAEARNGDPMPGRRHGGTQG
ncbi:MAG: guanylate kinase [Phycisphaeraceae bacterium]|nr:guanylate kinase [Phycisphaeraceae bacterium]